MTPGSRVVEQFKATDEAEDEQFGEARGDELPEELRTPEGRREFFRRARQPDKEDEPQAECEREYEFDPERIVARVQGREGAAASASSAGGSRSDPELAGRAAAVGGRAPRG